MTIIVLKLKRKGGTKIPLFDKIYHFKPASGDGTDPEVPHTCDIPDTDARALYRLLAIKEAYELHDPDAVLPSKPKAEPGQTIGNEKVDPNAAKPVIIKNPDTGEEINLTEMPMEDLAKMAKEQFGIAVHHKWKQPTIIAKIIEKMRGED
jgi:hypothetical protein